jgi:hypothetical protein
LFEQTAAATNTHLPAFFTLAIVPEQPGSYISLPVGLPGREKTLKSCEELQEAFENLSDSRVNIQSTRHDRVIDHMKHNEMPYTLSRLIDVR